MSGLAAVLVLAAAFVAPTAQAARPVATATAKPKPATPLQQAARACAGQFSSLQNELSRTQYFVLDGAPIDWTATLADLDAARGADCAQFPTITQAPLTLIGQRTATAMAKVGAGDLGSAFCALDDAVWAAGPTVYQLDKIAGMDVLLPVRGSQCR